MSRYRGKREGEADRLLRKKAQKRARRLRKRAVDPVQRKRKRLIGLGVAAGVKTPLHSHLARHSFATWMLSNNAKVQNVMRMLGHKNIKQTMKYAKVLAKDVHDDYNMVGEKLKSQTAMESPNNNRSNKKMASPAAGRRIYMEIHATQLHAAASSCDMDLRMGTGTSATP